MRLLPLLVLLACKAPVPTENPAEDAPTEVARKGFVIAHTNDLHAHFRPQPVDWAEGTVGGLLAISGAVEDLRDSWGEDRVLFLDGGDVRSGTPVDEYVVDGVRTGAMLQFMDAMGYDAWAVGNHEFDKGLADAGLFVATSKVAPLSSNLETESGEPLFPELERSKIFEVDGTKVGVIGATTPSLKKFVAGDMSAIHIVEPAVAAQREIDAHPEVEVWVALTHLGVEDDRKLAAGAPELDLIVGGHSHTRLEEAVKVGDTWIVQAGQYMQGLGICQITPKGDGSIDFKYQLTAPREDAVGGKARPAVQALYEQWTETLANDWGVAVGESKVRLTRSYDYESSMGNWVTWALAKRTGADVGLYNAGGLRSDIPSGTLTRETLYSAFPFGNEVVVAEVQGSSLIALALRNATALLDPENGSVVQQHGLTYGYREKLGSPELVDLKVNGEDVDVDATYKVVTNSFVLEQAQRYLGAVPTNPVGTGESVRDALAAVLAETGPIEAAPEPGGRKVE
ncbi:MAG: bifunctional metallophosphatase/5'-nucleotidase [Deltaproteobacteria bacterium]|nr:MAG: bifunctional metallophosphatase/5'-nucleotidase [Deltaproteobacteria bacterium]